MPTRVALLLILSACTPAVLQAPLTEPHGVVHLRVVHDSMEPYEDSAELGAAAQKEPQRLRIGYGRGGVETLRLAPGRHEIVLTSRGRTHVFVRRERTWPGGYGASCAPWLLGRSDPLGPPSSLACFDGSWSGMAREEQLELVPNDVDPTLCQRKLTVDVQPGGESTALLIAEDDVCTGCVLTNADARSCPGAAS
jgi:hypothetical protein